MINLETLILNTNRITKIENLENLPKLKRLEIRLNKLKKFENLNNLDNLYLLTVSCNLITEFKDEEISILPNLNELGLFGNFLGDENNEEENLIKYENCLQTISTKFPKLEKLYLGGNHFSKIKNWKEILKSKLINLKVLDGINI